MASQHNFDSIQFRVELARRWGHGGQRRLAQATGLSESLISIIARGYTPSARVRDLIFDVLGPAAARAITGGPGAAERAGEDEP